MLYIFIVPALIILASGIFELRRIQKHDNVLFAYAQLRRNILFYLKEYGMKISDTDYKIVNELLDRVDATIHHFTDFKTTYFNIRKLRKLTKKLKLQEIKTGFVLKKTQNKDINKLQKQYEYLIVKSCFTYTPFFRSEVFLKISFLVFKLFILAGVKKWQNLINDINWLKDKKSWLERPENQFNVYTG